MIFDDTSGGVIVVAHLVVNFLFRHINQGQLGNHISDFESSELEFRPVVSELAQKSISWLLQLHDVCGRYNLRVTLRLKLHALGNLLLELFDLFFLAFVTTLLVLLIICDHFCDVLPSSSERCLFGV